MGWTGVLGRVTGAEIVSEVITPLTVCFVHLKVVFYHAPYRVVPASGYEPAFH